MEKTLRHPNNLDEAMDIILEFYDPQIREALDLIDEEHFVATTHHAAGRYLRNEWFLWWQEGHDFDSWPKEKPAIVAFFNELGITHADDMSAIIFTSLHRRYKDIDIDLKGQIKHHQDFWKENGFVNGIPD